MAPGNLIPASNVWAVDVTMHELAKGPSGKTAYVAARRIALRELEAENH